MDEQKSHTSGPYGMRPTPGSQDAEIYSKATGQSVARVLSGKSHGDAPDDQTALRNAELFRAAPELRESLQRIVNEEQLRPEAASAARDLLASIASGASRRFQQEREEEMRAFEEIIAEQIREMSQPEPALDERESAEEDFGYSL